MAENENTEQPEETPAAEVAEPTQTALPPVAPARPRLRDRAFTFRSVLAVGVATLLLGGAGGAAIVAATSDDHGDRPRITRFGDGRPGDDQRFGGCQWGNGPGGPGMAPPNMQNGPRNAPDSGSGQEDSQPESGSNS